LKYKTQLGVIASQSVFV